MTDRYIKAVQTVIAVALVALVLQNATGSLKAQGDGIQKVQICDAPNRCANLGGRALGASFVYSLFVSQQ